MEIIGDYLMCRFYIDFTKTRLEMGLPYPIPPDAREAFHAELNKRVPPEYQDKDKDKEKRGRSTTLGLWMFSTDARDPLKEVMMRYEYIHLLHQTHVCSLQWIVPLLCAYGIPRKPITCLREESAAGAAASIKEAGILCSGRYQISGMSTFPGMHCSSSLAYHDTGAAR